MIAGADAIDEMNRLKSIEPGKGRLVSRFLKRYVESGEFEIRLDLAAGRRLVDLACLVAYMRQYTSESGAKNDVVQVVEVFPWTSRMSVSYVAKVGEVPTGMQDRLGLLRALHERLDLVVSVHKEWDSDEAAADLRSLFLGDEGGVEQVKAKVGRFDMVVRGVYTDVAELGKRWAALAATLNSQVGSVLPEGWRVEPMRQECSAVT